MRRTMWRSSNCASVTVHFSLIAALKILPRISLMRATNGEVCGLAISTAQAWLATSSSVCAMISKIASAK